MLVKLPSLPDEFYLVDVIALDVIASGPHCLRKEAW